MRLLSVSLFVTRMYSNTQDRMKRMPPNIEILIYGKFISHVGKLRGQLVFNALDFFRNL